MHDLLVGGMDFIVDPIRNNWQMENVEGSDDRRMLPLFEEWLGEVGNANATDIEEEQTPFYAQFYTMNTVRETYQLLCLLCTPR